MASVYRHGPDGRLFLVLSPAEIEAYRRQQEAALRLAQQQIAELNRQWDRLTLPFYPERWGR